MGILTNLVTIKSYVVFVFQLVFATLTFTVSQLFGGVNGMFYYLILAIGLDLITGLIKSVITKTSDKTVSGCFKSETWNKGVAKKISILIMVFVCYQLDIFLKSDTSLRDSCAVFYLVGELGSIIENFGLIGLPLPKFIKNMFETLKGVVEDEKK